jgi:Uma2 family endonuclease
MIANEPKTVEEPKPYRFTRHEYYRIDELGLFRGKQVELIEGTIYEHPGDAEPRPLRFTRDDYYRMADAGLFQGKRVELIEGTVIQMPAMKRPHWAAQIRTRDRLQAVFAAGYIVSTNAPLDLEEQSAPEPDVAVVPGTLDDYPDRLPTTAVLIVEVADTSVRYDQTEKASLYAKAGIQDYWIVNLVDRQVEVYRDPVPDPAQPSGFSYSTTQVFGPADSIVPIAMPQATIPAADLLP